MSILFPTVLLVLAFSVTSISCASKVPDPPEGEESAATTPPGYTGAALRASLAGGELVVATTVPSGGYGFTLKETARTNGQTVVRLCLESPAETEPVTMALEEKLVKIALKDETGSIHVELQERQRGAQYLVEPEYRLAKIVRR